MFSFTTRVGQPMGKPPYPGVARPLLFSPERFRGRDARAGVSPTLRNQVLSLTGRDREGLPRRGPEVILWRETQGPPRGGDARAGVSPTSGTRSSPSQGETERVFRREACGCEGVAARHRFLHARGQQPGFLLVLIPRLHASFPPVISKTLAHKPPRPTQTSALADTQGEKPLIPPPHSGGDRRPRPARSPPGCSMGRKMAAPDAHPPGRSALSRRYGAPAQIPMRPRPRYVFFRSA